MKHCALDVLLPDQEPRREEEPETRPSRLHRPIYRSPREGQSGCSLTEAQPSRRRSGSLHGHGGRRVSDKVPRCERRVVGADHVPAGHFLERTPAFSITSAKAGSDEDHDVQAKKISQVLRNGTSPHTLRAPPVELLSASAIQHEDTSVFHDEDCTVEIPVRSRFDFVTTTKRYKYSEEEDKNVNLLILQAGGAYNNELLAVVVSAPRFTRQHSDAAFADYLYYQSSAPSSRAVTPGLLREDSRRRGEEEAEEGHDNDDLEWETDYSNDAPLTKQILLHTFPSKICSVHFGPPQSSLGHVHPGPWVCIRTISSTLFASVELSSKKEKLAGHPEIRLVALLEIMHGDSALTSGVHFDRLWKSSQHRRRAQSTKSQFPIHDVRFHPAKASEAVTVDSRGNVGMLKCDLFQLRESSWDRSVSWSVLPNEQKEQRDAEWSTEWTDNEDVVVIANREMVQAVSLLDGHRTTIYRSPADATIFAMTRSEAPSSLLWLATTDRIVVFDIGIESSYQPLLSWEHNLNGGQQLHMSTTSAGRNCHAAVVSNPADRMLLVFTASISTSGVNATTRGAPRQIPSSLESPETYACAPRFLQVQDLHNLWHRWIRRVSLDKRAGDGDEKMMIEMSKDGRMTLKVLKWSLRSSKRPLQITRNATQSMVEADGDPKRGRTELNVERSLHSLGKLYSTLMRTRWGAEATEYRHALLLLNRVSRWLQEQDSPVESVLVPLDLLAICAEGDQIASIRSALLHHTLLTSIRVDDQEITQLLQRFRSSMEADAWLMDLGALLQSQLSATVPTVESELGDICSQMASHYLVEEGARQTFAHSAAQERLSNNLQVSCQEVIWDLLLSSSLISMRPVTVEEVEVKSEMERPSVELKTPGENPVTVPSFSFAFFSPRAAAPAASSSSTHSRSIIQKKAKKKILTTSARYLLSEWPVGVDPDEYDFSHPYRDDLQEGVSGSEEYFSQSDVDQQVESRARSSSTRSVSASQFDHNTAPSQTASQPLPPAISSSASQNISASGISNNTAVATRRVPPVFHSQPISMSPTPARTRPKKRRIGGF